ncbi:MAG: hypothetical protein M0R32_03120 [Candidatus Cloacimonetes bacterium]|jgi:hypothetical protein|nr:hypothetical protein [Candidatus Cloacimonadota bacterium]
MKIIQITKTARKKLADKSVSWEEIYTPDTAYFKAMYDDILGKGSYFRFEGKDSETGDWHMVVVAPAKMHDPQSKFFAGQRKLPSDYSASGEYFPDLKQALNHANNHWGITFPSDANLGLSSGDLKGIGDKADEWRSENKKEDIVAKFDKKITDPKNDPRSASVNGKLIRCAMAEEKFRNRPASRYFDLDELDREMPADWDQVVEAWPNIVVELEYARSLRASLREMLMERYGNRGADPEMHKMWLANCPEPSAKKGKPYGSHIVSIGPYLGKKFSDGAANTFSPFTQSLTVYNPEDIQRTLTKAINDYQEEFGVLLNPQDFSLPKQVANKFMQHFVKLKASGKEKLLGSVATGTGISTEDTGWKSVVEQRIEAQQKEWLARQQPNLKLDDLKTKDVNGHIVAAWEAYRTAIQNGENVPKPPMLDVTKFGNDKYTEGAQRPSGIIKYPAFKVVGNLTDGTTSLTVVPSVDGQNLKRIGAGSVIRLTTYNSEGDYRYSKQEHIVDSFVTETGSNQGLITLKSPMNIDIAPSAKAEEDWKKDYLLEVTQRVDVIEGNLVDWSLENSEIVKRTGFSIEKVRNDRKAYDAMFYGFNDMQSALDLGWKTGKYIPKRVNENGEIERVVVQRNFTKAELEAFATIKSQNTVDSSPVQPEPVPEEQPAVEGVEGVQGVQGVGPAGTVKEETVPPKSVEEEKVPVAVEPEPEEEDDDSEFEEFLKKNQAPGHFAETVRGISVIAQDLKKMGKKRAAKEVQSMLKKYL